MNGNFYNKDYENRIQTRISIVSSKIIADGFRGIILEHIEYDIVNYKLFLLMFLRCFHVKSSLRCFYVQHIFLIETTQ